MKISSTDKIIFYYAVGLSPSKGPRFFKKDIKLSEETKTLVRLWALQQVEAALRKKEEK